jgi:hypothetical protein
MTFNGNPQTVNPAGWIAVNCGHEVQINDSPDGPPNDPHKTGSIYGFADLNAAQARTTPVGSGTTSRSASSASTTRSSATG